MLVFTFGCTMDIAHGLRPKNDKLGQRNFVNTSFERYLSEIHNIFDIRSTTQQRIEE